MAVQGYAVGLARAFFWTYSLTGTQAGFATGTQTTLANGSTSSPYLMSNVKTANINWTPVAELQIQGGDRIVAVPMFGNPRMAPFDVITSDIDDGLITLVQGTATNTVNPFFTKFSWNPNRTTPNGALGMCLQQRFETTTGFSYFLTRLVPRMSGTMHPGNMAFRAESDTVVHVSSITSSTNYQGQTYGSTGLAFTAEADKMDYYDLYSANPWFFTCFRQDGTTTSVSLPYRPLSTTVTINNTPNELVIIDNTGAPTITALSAITTGASAAATLAAAGTAAFLDVITYQTNFVPS